MDSGSQPKPVFSAHVPRESGLRSDSANHPDPSDETLLSLCAGGDRDAFMRLYDRYSRRVYGLVITVVGRGPEADDALQDAMWEVWRRAGSYNPGLGSPSGWILMLARGRAIDLLRRRRRVAALPEKAARRGLTRTDGAPEPSPESGELADRCSRLLSKLPPDQASVIRMAFVQGLTREEIADALGIPVGTVKTRIRAGVRMLGGALAAETEPDGPDA